MSANLVIKRERYFVGNEEQKVISGSGVLIHICLDSKEIGTIRHGEEVKFSIESGEHLIFIQYNILLEKEIISSPVMNFEIKDGENLNLFCGFGVITGDAFIGTQTLVQIAEADSKKPITPEQASARASAEQTEIIGSCAAIGGFVFIVGHLFNPSIPGGAIGGFIGGFLGAVVGVIISYINKALQRNRRSSKMPAQLMNITPDIPAKVIKEPEQVKSERKNPESSFAYRLGRFIRKMLGG